MLQSLEKLWSYMNGFGVLRGAHFKGVVVVLGPQKTGCVHVTADAVDEPCINGRSKIERVCENCPLIRVELVH